MAKRHARKHLRARPEPRLVDLVAKAPRKLLAVLHKHGVSFCAGCYLTLSSSPERAAAYHAVADREAFLRDLRRALRRR